MASANSTKRRSGRQRDLSFPLYQHASGQWCKRVKGRLVYFGTDKEAALARWLDEKDALLAGRRPRRECHTFTVRDAANEFLSYQQNRVTDGEIGQRHFNELHRACEIVIEAFGKHTAVDDLRPDDFAPLRRRLAKRYGLARFKNTIIRIRSLFKWCYENDRIDRPVKYGTQFSVPSKRHARKAKAEAKRKYGDQAFTPEQVRELLATASVEMRAMILLALNTGIGNRDIALLELCDIDLEQGFLDSARHKTGVERRAALWTETREAIDNVLAIRKTPRLKVDRDLIFVTKYRGPWAPRDGGSGSAITAEFRKLLDRTGIYRRGLSFYGLRRTYRTIADETMDWPAIDYTMGHARDDMGDAYRQSINDERLVAIANHVRTWLYAEGGAK